MTISKQHLATVVEGLSILPTSSGREFRPGHYELLLKLLNERSKLDPEPLDAELTEAALRYMEEGTFFPTPRDLILLLRAVRDERRVSARERLQEGLEARWRRVEGKVIAAVREILPEKPDSGESWALKKWAAQANEALEKECDRIGAAHGFKLQMRAFPNGKTSIQPVAPTDEMVTGELA